MKLNVNLHIQVNFNLDRLNRHFKLDAWWSVSIKGRAKMS